MNMRYLKSLGSRLKLTSYSFLLALALGGSALKGQTSNQTAFVFTNNTGLPDDQVFLSLTNFAGDGTNTYYDGGAYSSLSNGTLYSLASLEGTISGTTLGSVPTLYAGNVTSGQLTFTLGSTADTANPVTGIVELTSVAATASPNDNLDVTYVNGVGMPIGYSVNNRSDNTPLALPNQANPIVTNGTAMGSNLVNDPYVPTAARTTNTYNVTSSNGKTYTISGTTYVAASNVNPNYHDWSTNQGGYTSVSNTLENAGTSISISSYTTTTGSSNPALPTNILFGYGGSSGAGAYSPFNNPGTGTSSDPENLFLNKQDYNMTGTYKTDITSGLTSDQIAALTASNPGIVAGTHGIVISGTGTNPGGTGVGSFTVYITQSSLNNPNGLYGGNPVYTVVWTPPAGDGTATGAQVTTQQGSNNLVDRVVGDLAGGTQWGWSTSTVTVKNQANNTGTAAALAGTVFDTTTGSLKDTPINQLSTGQYFYLLSLEGANQQDWSGAALNPTNPLLYANYISDVTGTSGGYTAPYTDRLVGVSPDTYYAPPSLPDNTVSDLYINVILGPSGAYSVSVVPEPSTWALIGFGLLFIGFRAYRSRRQA